MSNVDAMTEAEPIHVRMDFATEVIKFDEATHTALLKFKPDPRRYVVKEIDGRRHYFDKYLDWAIPFEEMNRMMTERVGGVPIYHNPPSVESAPAYAADRRKALISEVQGGEYVVPKEKAVAHTEIDLTKGPRLVTFISMDICGSSALRRSDPEKFDKAYQILIRELGTVVGQFNGTIYTATGDGFLAYIDTPSVNTQCDNAIDMGLTLLRVLADSVNPALSKADLPPLNIRVGADFGVAEFREIQVPVTGFSKAEVASNALNNAVKIEKSAEMNQFRIGRGLYEHIHVQWLERCEPDLLEGNPPQKVYVVN